MSAPRAATHHVSIVGFAGCSFHSAALRHANRTQQALKNLRGKSHVNELELFTKTLARGEFERWLGSTEAVQPATGSTHQTSPHITLDAAYLGGYTDLKRFLNTLEIEATSTNLVPAATRKRKVEEGSSVGVRAPVVGVLTLATHRAGPWLLDLTVNLLRQGAVVRVLCVDDICAGDLPLDIRPDFDVIVNRVSDAAPLSLMKLAQAYLLMAEANHIHVVNGARCYSIGCNKILHHVMLTQAGLATPRSVAVRSWNQLEVAAKDLRFPLMLKPNAAGFGKGIVGFETVEELQKHIAAHGDGEISSDGVAVVQERILPIEGVVYRIWILGQKVQCGVRVPAMGVDSTGATTASGCMGSAQSQTKAGPALGPVPWKIPPEVEEAALRVMALCGADCGSVELMYASNANSTESQTTTLYFDVNMLSTLPDTALIRDEDKIWPPDFDPYSDLAKYILDKARENSVSCTTGHGSRR